MFHYHCPKKTPKNHQNLKGCRGRVPALNRALSSQTTYPAVSEPRRPEDVHLRMSLLQDSPQTHAAARLLHSVIPRPRLDGDPTILQFVGEVMLF